MCTVAVKGYEDETNKGQNEGNINCRPAKDDLLVDEMALQRGHQRTAYDGHHQEGGTERGVFGIDILQRYTIDGREHDGHE